MQRTHLAILQFTTNGVSHKQLEEDYQKSLEKAFKAGIKEGKRQSSIASVSSEGS